MIKEKEIEKTTKKHTYLFAFLLGMFLMLLAYIFFESATQARYRSNEQSEGDTADTQNSLNLTASSYVTVKTETATDAYLGIEIQDVDAVIAKEFSLPSQAGVLINSVIPGSPAEEGGLQRGDVIVGFNNRTVKDTDHFKELLAALEPEERVKVVILREGKKQSLYIELGSREPLKKTALAEEAPSLWGVTLGPVSERIRNTYNIPEDINGVAVLSVAPGGEASSKGILPGDVIRGVDRTEVTDMESFFTAVSDDDDTSCLLDLYSSGSSRYVSLSSLTVSDQDKVQEQLSLKDRLFSVFTGGMPFGDDEDEEEEGPKGGKFAAEEKISLTASDTPAFNRPSSVPGDINTGGTTGGSSNITGMNRPSEVPPQAGGPDNDIVLFIGLLLMVILYLAYREYHRPVDID